MLTSPISYSTKNTSARPSEEDYVMYAEWTMKSGNTAYLTTHRVGANVVVVV